MSICKFYVILGIYVVTVSNFNLQDKIDDEVPISGYFFVSSMCLFFGLNTALVKITDNLGIAIVIISFMLLSITAGPFGNRPE